MLQYNCLHFLFLVRQKVAMSIMARIFFCKKILNTFHYSASKHEIAMIYCKELFPAETKLLELLLAQLEGGNFLGRHYTVTKCRF